MSAGRYYCPELNVGPLPLPSEEARHFTVSRRGRAGDALTLFDGQGREADGVVHRIRRKEVIVEVGSIRERPFELPIRLSLASAVARQQRQAYLVEKCTELGLDAYIPLITDRGVAKVDGHALEKWRRRAVEAAKQAERAWVTRMEPPQEVDELLSRGNRFDLTLVAHPRIEAVPLSSALSGLPRPATVLVLIGPEGGWSDRERAAMTLRGAMFVSLGPLILRTETAAVATCAVAAAQSVERR